MHIIVTRKIHDIVLQSPVVSSCISDPYVLVLLADNTLCLYKVDTVTGDKDNVDSMQLVPITIKNLKEVNI